MCGVPHIFKGPNTVNGTYRVKKRSTPSAVANQYRAFLGLLLDRWMNTRIADQLLPRRAPARPSYQASQPSHVERVEAYELGRLNDPLKVAPALDCFFHSFPR